MNTNLSLEFIITIVTLIVGLIAIIKFLFDLNTKITKLETKLADFQIENQKEHFAIQKQMLQFEMRLDKYDGVNTDLDLRINEVKTTFENQISEVKTDTVKQTDAINSRISRVEDVQQTITKELIIQTVK